jgi:hypothetical protein
MTIIRFLTMAFICNFLLTNYALANTAMAQSAFGDPVEQSGGPSSDLVAVEEDVSGGAIPVGSTAQVIVRFRNESGRPIEFRNVNLYPSSTISANITVNECSTEPLTSGAECAMIIAIKGLQPGNWRTEMLIRHTGRSRLVTARINGSVDATSDDVNIINDVEVTPSPIEFGTLQASRPIIRSVTIRNVTADIIDISDVYIDAPMQSGYDLRSDCKSLNSGQACIASILWSPSIEGPSSGFLVIEHSGASAVANIPISGEFSPGQAQQASIFPDSLPGRGVLVSSETEINFGTGINSQSAITISLVNVGDAGITLENITLAGSENGLKLLNNGCSDGLVLEPTGACPLTIAWAPTKTGSVIDDVRIVHDGARGILVLPVRGTADQAISVDSKPIIVTGGRQIVDGISTSFEPNTGSSGLPTSGTPPVLDGYIVTSHSKKHAIIRGPVGSRIVADGKTTLIGGFEWKVDITDIGVRLTSGVNIVILVFDRSLSTPVSSTTTATGGET